MAQTQDSVLLASAVLDTPRTITMEPTVITAQFVPSDVRSNVSTVNIINRTKIEQQGSVNLQELLQTESNVRLSQDAILGSSVSINGLGGENVKVLVDGVPVVGRQSGNIDLGQIQLNNIQQVEIIEGAQSILYGSDASAGVINLVNKKSQLKPFEAELNSQAESNGFLNAQGRLGWRYKKFYVQSNGSWQQFSPKVDTSSRDQVWNPKRQHQGRVLLRYAPDKRLDIRLSGSVFKEAVDNLGAINRPQYKPYAFDDYYNTTRKDLSLHAEGWLKDQYFWQTSLAVNDFVRYKNTYRYEMNEGTQALVAGEQDTSLSRGYLGRAVFAKDNKSAWFNYLVGAEYYRESASGSRIVDSTSANPSVASRTDYALFTSLKGKFFSTLTTQAGLRYTQNKVYGRVFTPAFWVLWQANNALSVRASYANGFRAPSLKELYFNFIDINHYIVGNTNLVPETSHNLRAEIKYQDYMRPDSTWHAQVSLAGFYNQVHNRMILAEYAPMQYNYSNLKKWTTMGAELGFTLNYKNRIEWQSKFILTGYYNTYSEEQDSLPLLNWSPDLVNTLTVNVLQQNKLGLRVWHKMTGKTPYFYETADGQITQGQQSGWHSLNASLSTSFCNQNIKLTGGVKNILGISQINVTGSNGGTHTGADSSTRPVHWGRTWFLEVICRLSK